MWRWPSSEQGDCANPTAQYAHGGGGPTRTDLSANFHRKPEKAVVQTMTTLPRRRKSKSVQPPYPSSRRQSVVQPFTIPFSEATNCWISIANRPHDLGELIGLTPNHLMRAICQVVANPIGIEKWKLDQQKIARQLSEPRQRTGSPEVIKRSLFGQSTKKSGLYDPRAQLSVAAFHPRDMYPSKFHMPAEDPLFAVRINFIHVVKGLNVPESAGCPQFRANTPGVIKLVPIVEIAERSSDDAFLGKERDLWFEIPEDDIATFECFKLVLADRNIRGLQTVIMKNRITDGIDGSWKQLITGATEIVLIRSSLVGKPFEPENSNDLIRVFDNLPPAGNYPARNGRGGEPEWAPGFDSKNFNPLTIIWDKK
ncbi:hypothetical protein FN846DRAFT_887489 [Sphaerosporella brunnea]|uniref:Uncharacterized protein n=1 Tax=Sphaerosporella brunnea TaxID=1250544 RepID=A0A5J5F6B9_9PEZI|nr:hypothetical protein FN846DRAFT_887489 [Sphaerosporella brunnea]